MGCKDLDCLSFCRCCRCPCQRYRHCVVTLRPALVLSSASPRVPAQISCSLSKFRSLCHLESQVQYAMYLCLHCHLVSSCLCKRVLTWSGASAGHTVEMSRLHLLHGDPTAQTWTDITSQVSLYVTHLYAIFYITHFSW